MHVQLTVAWTLGMLVTIGALLRVDPFPWLWLGLAILLYGMYLLRREIRGIQNRSQRMEAIAVSLIKRGEIDDVGSMQGLVSVEDTTDPYARADNARLPQVG